MAESLSRSQLTLSQKEREQICVNQRNLCADLYQLMILDSAVERGCRVQLLGLNAFVQKRGFTRWVS